MHIECTNLGLDPSKDPPDGAYWVVGKSQFSSVLPVFGRDIPKGLHVWLILEEKTVLNASIVIRITL